MPVTTDRITALIRELGPSFTPPPLSLKWAAKRSDQERYFTALDRLVRTRHPARWQAEAALHRHARLRRRLAG